MERESHGSEEVIRRQEDVIRRQQEGPSEEGPNQEARRGQALQGDQLDWAEAEVTDDDGGATGDAKVPKSIQDAWDARDGATKSAGEHARKLCYVGLAAVLVFGGINLQEVEFPVDLPDDLLLVGLAFGGALAADLLQYVYASMAWAIWAGIYENKDEPPEQYPRWINWPINVFFWGKIALTGYGWLLLLGRMLDAFQ